MPVAVRHELAGIASRRALVLAVITSPITRSVRT
jgi:hypothetical protein